MISGDSFGGLLDLGGDGAVVLLEVLGMLQDAVEVFLLTEGHTKQPLLLHFGNNVNNLFIFSSL